MIYRIPYTFQMFGRIEVEAENLTEAYHKADNELTDMSTSDLLIGSNYIDGSLEIYDDGILTRALEIDDGIVLDENENIVE